MISVQNLQRLLNGNKWLILLAFMITGLSSCDMFKKAQSGDTSEDDRTELDEVQGTSVYNPETGEYEPSTTVIETVDTVKWTVDPNQAPPISSDATDEVSPGGLDSGSTDLEPDGPGQKLGVYNVAVILPFFTNRFTDASDIDNASMAAVNFYGGMKLAFDELGMQGIKIKASVFDTKGAESTTTQLMNKPEVADADLIIGPFRRNNIKVAAEMAKNVRTPLVSPVSASSGVAKDNPYFIQVNPYLPTHCQAITQHAKNRFRSDQIVLVARNKKAEISRFKYFQDENKKIEGSAGTERFKEYIITSEGLNLDDIDITPYLVEGDTTVFVVPSFSNKNFVYGLLLQIYNQKGDNPVVVYGLPQWKDFEPPSYDYYELLHLHISSAHYFDRDNQDVKHFQRKYVDKFGTLPSERAYVGYDVMMYFGKMLKKHGTKFQERIDSEMAEYLNTKFNFVREVPLAAALAEDFSKTNLYENKHVYILKFEDYQFQKTN